MNIKLYLLPVAFLCNLLPINPSIAQSTITLLDCASVDSDSDGDGFGFENGESCIVVGGQAQQAQIGQCVDADGDGFGWNGIETCDPSSNTIADDQAQPGQCIDTDGDGFGWDGFNTCDPGDTTLANCAITGSDTDGDGFGFEDGRSCLVVGGQPDSSQAPDIFRCDDVGSYPWGWNPDTRNSCRLDLVNSPSISSLRFNSDTRIHSSEIIDLPLICKRIEEVSFFEINDGFDQLQNVQEFSDIFFTATLKNLNQITQSRGRTVDVLDMEGSWIERFPNEVPVFRDIENDSLRFFSATTSTADNTLDYHRVDGQIFMSQLFSDRDFVIFGTSHCVERYHWPLVRQPRIPSHLLNH